MLCTGNFGECMIEILNATQAEGAREITGESITDFETRIRTIARKTKYTGKTDPGQELMRDRLCTGVHNADLREVLLRHYKEDGKTPYTFEEQLATAKSWEAAHNTLKLISQADHY